MKKLSCFLFLAFAMVLLISCGDKSSKPSSDKLSAGLKDSASYAIGADFARSVKGFGITELNYSRVMEGIKDVMEAEDGKAKYSDEEINTLFRSYISVLSKIKGEENIEKGKAFLDENKTKEGVIELSGGLQMKVLEEGTGPQPLQAADTVEVNYRGSLINGTEFDSSYKYGTTAEFPLNHVIIGWTEGIQQMKVGGKYMLYIPGDMAYGEQAPRGSGIGANEVLIFEIELLDVRPFVEAPEEEIVVNKK